MPPPGPKHYAGRHHLGRNAELRRTERALADQEVRLIELLIELRSIPRWRRRRVAQARKAVGEAASAYRPAAIEYSAWRHVLGPVDPVVRQPEAARVKSELGHDRVEIGVSAIRTAQTPT